MSCRRSKGRRARKEGKGGGQRKAALATLSAVLLARCSLQSRNWLLTLLPHASACLSRRTLVVVRDFMAYFSNAVAASKAPRPSNSS